LVPEEVKLDIAAKARVVVVDYSITYMCPKSYNCGVTQIQMMTIVPSHPVQCTLKLNQSHFHLLHLVLGLVLDLVLQQLELRPLLL
jgi:hypothetical protein